MKPPSTSSQSRESATGCQRMRRRAIRKINERRAPERRRTKEGLGGFGREVVNLRCPGASGREGCHTSLGRRWRKSLSSTAASRSWIGSRPVRRLIGVGCSTVQPESTLTSRLAVLSAHLSLVYWLPLAQISNVSERLLPSSSSGISPLSSTITNRL